MNWRTSFACIIIKWFATAILVKGVEMVNLKAQITYRNKDMKTVSKCEYDLRDYTDMLSLDLKRIITDIEDLVYIASGSRSKDD